MDRNNKDNMSAPHLRPFEDSPRDYQALARLVNAELANKHETAQSLTNRDHATKASTPDWFEKIHTLSNQLDRNIPGLFDFVDPSRSSFTKQKLTSRRPGMMLFLWPLTRSNGLA